jgi:predicted outer membrane repeat protein
MVALSLMATTSLMSSYVSLLRTEPSFAAADTSGCSSVEELSIEVSGTRTEDVGRILTLQAELNTAISESTDRCVTVTFQASGPDSVLNFTYPDAGNIFNVYEYLNLFSTGDGNYPKIIFIGNDVTLDFDFDSGTSEGATNFNYSPIRTDLALEIHDITFLNSSVISEYYGDAEGGVINAENNLSIYGSEFSYNSVSGTTVRADGGAIFAADNAIISDTTFRGNRAEGNGGAVYLGDDATITESYFTHNYADQSDYIYSYPSPSTQTSSRYEWNDGDGDQAK